MQDSHETYNEYGSISINNDLIIKVLNKYLELEFHNKVKDVKFEKINKIYNLTIKIDLNFNSDVLKNLTIWQKKINAFFLNNFNISNLYCFLIFGN